MSFRPSPAAWGVIVSGAFAVALQFTEIPPSYQRLISTLAWVSFVFAVVGWLGVRSEALRRWRSSPKALRPMTLLAVFLLSGLIGMLVWLLIPDSKNSEKQAGSPRTTLEISASPAYSPNPFPVGRDLRFDINVKNHGIELLRNIGIAHALYLRPSAALAEDQEKLIASFEHIWPRLRAMSRSASPGLTLEPGASLPIARIALPVSEEQRQDILSGELLALVVAGIRYEDSSGVHEFHLARYPTPPFVGLRNWKSATGHDDDYRDVHEARVPIQVSYDLGALPLLLEPSPSSRIVGFTDDKTMRMTWAQQGAVPYFWPIDQGPIASSRRQIVGVLTVSNHHTSTVLNVVTELEAQFRPGGPYEESLDQGWERLKGSRNLGNRSVPLSIEMLQPGESVRVYVVNQSGYSIVMPLPVAGTLEMPGEVQKRDVDFKLRQNTFADRPEVLINASPHVWEGDRIIGARQSSQ